MNTLTDLLNDPVAPSAEPPSATAALKQRVQRIRAQQAQREAAATDSEVQQLPLWPDKVRGLPNALARSALFTVGNAMDSRENLMQREIFSIRGVTVQYTGVELRSDDEDVFLQVVHLARLQPLGEQVEFKAHSVLKALRWDTSGAGYERLRTVLTRLQATAVMVAADGMEKGYSGSLVTDFSWDQNHWTVKLNPKLIRLFGATQYTRLEWEQRMSLPPLAKKLHAFYVTHREPFPLRVATLKDLCGSKIKLLSQFRPPLKKALDRLVEIGFLAAWSLDKATDLVHVTRAHQESLPPPPAAIDEAKPA